MKKTILFFSCVAIFLNANSQTIQFTNQVIYDDNPTIQNATKTFKAEDPIYGVIHFKDAIMNMPIAENPGTTVNIGYFVSIDNQPIVSNLKGTFGDIVPGAMFSIEYNDVYSNEPITIVLHPSDNDRFKSNILKQGPMKAFMPALAKAGEGKHNVTVNIKFMDGGKLSNTIATGSFDIEVSKSIKWEAASRFPAAKKNDAALVESMIKALKDNGWQYTVKKINIVESDWEIHKNAFGTITHRSIDTYVGFVMKDNSCKVFNISFKQVYSGSYGKTQVNGTGQSFVVDCNEIK